MEQHSGRVALVTGAARGIGLQVARRLAQEGAHVVLLDVMDEASESAGRLVREGLKAEAVVTDVSDEAAVRQVVAGIAGRHGRLDILVNNAGISPKHDGKKAPVETTALAEWNAVMAVNLTAAFLLCRESIPVMRARSWGRIVNMSSQAGRTRARIAGSHYAASKAGLIGFSRSLAGEVGAYGITVNCIAPGRIETPMAAVASDEVNRAFLSQVPMGRIGTPDDIAATVSFLASDGAGYITGATIDVNGGHFMA
jgi:3-oxoacyl-[acyl-carrier protein] reductase